MITIRRSPARRSVLARSVRSALNAAAAAPARAPLITIASAEAAIAAEHGRDNLAMFSGLFWHLTSKEPLVWTWHIDALAAVTEAVVCQRIAGAVINLPPGLSKSTICSRMAVPFAWIKRPSLRVIGASHSLGLQHRLQRHRREICRSRDYLDLIPRDEAGEPIWQLDRKMSGVTIFGTADTGADRSIAGGWCAAASRKGGVGTGDHAGLHIYDDPLSGRARHTIERGRTNTWITDTMASRFGSTRLVLGVMQMLHADDPTHALRRAHPQIKRVVLPMVYDAGRDDYEHAVDLGAPSALQQAAFDGERHLGWFRERLQRAGLHIEAGTLRWRDPRRHGDLLCPERFGWDHVEKRKRHPGVYAAEDDQNPTSASASVIVAQWWRRWRVLPSAEPDELMWGVDTQTGAVHDVANPDWTVISVWARWGPKLYFIEEARGRWSTPDAARVIFLMHLRWGSGGRRFVERANAGPSLVSLLRDHVGGLLLVAPDGEDIQRIELAGARIQAGDCYAPEDGAARPRFLRRGEPWPMCELRADDERLPRQLRPVHELEEPVLAVVGADGWVEESLREWNEQPGAPHNDRPAAGALVLLAAPAAEPDRVAAPPTAEDLPASSWSQTWSR